jgi:hypothetical protein
MPIFHKFHLTNQDNGFETHNAILDVTPYDPELMFIGHIIQTFQGIPLIFFTEELFLDRF